MASAQILISPEEAESLQETLNTGKTAVVKEQEVSQNHCQAQLPHVIGSFQPAGPNLEPELSQAWEQQPLGGGKSINAAKLSPFPQHFTAVELAVREAARSLQHGSRASKLSTANMAQHQAERWEGNAQTQIHLESSISLLRAMEVGKSSTMCFRWFNLTFLLV